MIAYKLLTLRKDGTLGPLFINRKLRIPVGEWLEAEDHPTKGYAHRPGWHCCMNPRAPHLTEHPRQSRRIWCAVEVEDFEFFERPESQGGVWVLAQRMKLLGTVKGGRFEQG